VVTAQSMERMGADIPGYVLEQVLARGLNGVFIRGRAQSDGAPVVIKRMRAIRDRATADQLKRDYTALGAVTERAIVSIRDASFDRVGHVVFAPPEGATTLRNDLRGGPPSVQEGLAIALDLARGLARGHAHGVLHLGVRPSNILIHRAPRARAILFDFGMARNVALARTSLSSRDDLERLLYAAPEQTGLARGAIDQRADLWALGAVLYELFTGRFPFSGSTAEELFHEQIARCPPSPIEIRSGIGSDLSALIVSLLAKDPADRQDCVDEVVTELRRINEDRLDSSASFRFRPKLERPSVPIAALAGRSGDLERARRAIDAAAKGSGRLLFVGGPRGSGKSALLKELARLDQRRAIFAFGNATELERDVPLAPLPEALASLADLLHRGPSSSNIERNPTEPSRAARAIRDSLGDDAGEISAIAPELAQIFGPAATGSKPKPRTIVDLFSSTSRIFKQPLVLIIDNLQWADPALHDLLWTLATDVAERAISVILAHSTDDARSSEVAALIRELERVARDTVETIELQPLSLEDTSALLCTSLGAEPPVELASAILRLSQGNPLHSLEALRGFISEGAVEVREGRVVLRTNALDHVPLSTGLTATMERRAATLGSAGSTILSAAALFSGPFRSEEIAEITGATPAEISSAIESAIALRLLEFSERGLTFIHQRARELFSRRLAPEDARRLHERIGRMLSTRPGDESAFEAALHLSRGEHASASVPKLITAARFARDHHLFGRAAVLWDRALELDERSPQRAEILEGSGDAALFAGRADPALDSYESALALATTDLDRARLHRKGAEVLLRRGDSLGAVARFEDALRILESSRSIIGRLRAERFVSEERALIFERMADAWSFLDGRRSAEARKKCPKKESGNSSSLSVWSRAQAALAEGIDRRQKGAHAEAQSSLRSAADLFVLSGDRRSEALVHAQLGPILIAAGDLASAQESLAALLRAAQDLGDRRLEALGWAGLAELSLLFGKHEAALDRARKVKDLEPDPLIGALGAAVEGRVELARGSLLEARASLDRAVRLVDSGRFSGEEVASIWVASAEQCLELAKIHRGSAIGSGALKEAIRAVRRASREARSFPGALASVLRAEAAAARASGQSARATALLERSIEEAKSRGQRYDLARAHFELGRTAIEEGDAKRSESHLALSEDVFRAIGAQLELQQVLQLRGQAVRGSGSPDREAITEKRKLDTLYRASALVSSMRDVDRLVDTVMDMALTATGAECGVLLLVEPAREDGRLAVRVSRNVEGRSIDLDPAQLDQAVIDEVISTRAPRIAGGPRRSILCVPLKREDRIAGVIYVENGQIADLFTRYDLEALSALAALVAVTLENAYAYRHIAELNDGLEERIKVRTKELQESQLQLLQSEKLASIGQLAAGVAHEIRNPLNGIKLAAELLRRHVDRGELDKLPGKVSAISEEVERANRHISNLLLYSRPKAPARASIALDKVIDQALKLVENQISLQSILVERRYEHDLPSLLADPHVLEQVFVNLLLNAAQAMANGGKLVLSVARKKGALCATVSDDGHGIPEEHLGRIFDPFFTTKEPGKGTGLGLSICQAAIRKLGGEISVESRVGAGTSFTVRLPLEIMNGS
jgi:signal transduction histidine kinase/serine/threonine protein kinase